MIDVDLLGDPMLPQTPTKGRRISPAPAGYFAPPGTGPVGETCKTCIHAYRRRMAKVYWKCERSRALWTGGRKTDILLRSPACSGWAQKKREVT